MPVIVEANNFWTQVCTVLYRLSTDVKQDWLKWPSGMPYEYVLPWLRLGEFRHAFVQCWSWYSHSIHIPSSLAVQKYEIKLLILERSLWRFSLFTFTTLVDYSSLLLEYVLCCVAMDTYECSSLWLPWSVFQWEVIGIVGKYHHRVLSISNCSLHNIMLSTSLTIPLSSPPPH